MKNSAKPTVKKYSNIPLLIYPFIFLIIKMSFPLSDGELWVLFLTLAILATMISVWIDKKVDKRENLQK